jgi:hypothetical protein
MDYLHKNKNAMTDTVMSATGQVGRLLATPFAIWMAPATRTLYSSGLTLIGRPVYRGAFWGAVGWFGLEYFKPNLGNIYNGESRGRWKAVDMNDPDATYTPPWLIATWMAYVGYAFI